MIFKGFSVQDGPGIRTTVFLKGCPLRCPWCHSPESQAFHTQLSWMSVRCIGVAECGKCLEACPKGAITPGKLVQQPGNQERDPTRPHRSVSLVITVANAQPPVIPMPCLCAVRIIPWKILLNMSAEIKPFYDQSDGGVTISGGEALSQPFFTHEVLKGVKALGIHTALDTTGFAAYKHIEAVFPYTDLFLYDFKHMNSVLHEKMVGVPNGLILENAQKIARAGGRMQVRIPIIPKLQRFGRKYPRNR